MMFSNASKSFRKEESTISTSYPFNEIFSPLQYETKFAFYVSDFDWDVAIASTIVHQQFEILKKIGSYIKSTSHFQTRSGMAKFCFEQLGLEQGVKYYELVLKCYAFQMFLFTPEISETLECGAEYFQTHLKFFFSTIPPPSKWSFKFQNSQNCAKMLGNEKAMKSLIECVTLKGDKESWKIALKFAFLMGFENEFNSLIEQEKHKWNDIDLLDLFQSPIPTEKFSEKNQRLLKWVLENLSSNAKIKEIDIAFYLEFLLISQKTTETFKSLWNEKRIVRTPEFANLFVLHNIRNIPKDLFAFLIPQCSLSTQSKVILTQEMETIQRESSQPMEFRNACLLRAIILERKNSDLDEIQKLCQPNWNASELLEHAFDFCKPKNSFISDSYNHVIIWLFNQTSINNRTFWEKENRILYVLLKASELGRIKTIDDVLEQFEDFDLSVNNNEFLKSILKYASIEPEFVEDLFSSFRVKDENERQQLLEMAKKNPTNSEKFCELINLISIDSKK